MKYCMHESVHIRWYMFNSLMYRTAGQSYSQDFTHINLKDIPRPAPLSVPLFRHPSFLSVSLYPLSISKQLVQIHTPPPSIIAWIVLETTCAGGFPAITFWHTCKGTSGECDKAVYPCSGPASLSPARPTGRSKLAQPVPALSLLPCLIGLKAPVMVDAF